MCTFAIWFGTSAPPFDHPKYGLVLSREVEQTTAVRLLVGCHICREVSERSQRWWWWRRGRRRWQRVSVRMSVKYLWCGNDKWNMLKLNFVNKTLLWHWRCRCRKSIHRHRNANNFKHLVWQQRMEHRRYRIWYLAIGTTEDTKQMQRAWSMNFGTLCTSRLRNNFPHAIKMRIHRRIEIAENSEHVLPASLLQIFNIPCASPRKSEAS